MSSAPSSSRPRWGSRTPTRADPAVPFEEELDTDEGWAKFNMPYWRRDWPGFVDFFMERMLPEPHSTKQFEDMVGWGLETDPETIIKTKRAAYLELDGVVEPGH